MSDYPTFRKIPRLHKDVVITEKLDGTNGLIHIERVPMGFGLTYGDGSYPKDRFVVLDESEHDEAGLPTHEFIVRAGSRNRWLAPGADNHGFCAWVQANAVELVKLGPGHHYGEWFGKGINRGYGLEEKRFALFNVARWYDIRDEPDGIHDLGNARPCPSVCTVVPVLRVDNAKNLNNAVIGSLYALSDTGSWAVKGFANPEGVVVYHMAAGVFFKVLLEGDDIPKSLQSTELHELTA